jgi:hypothetical protein
MEKALRGVPESFMERPEQLTPIQASDPSTGKESAQEFVYREHLPPVEESKPTIPFLGGGPLP